MPSTPIYNEKIPYPTKNAQPMMKDQKLQHLAATTCILLATVFSATTAAARGGDPEQQVALADPFILYDKGTYYAYGTGSDNGIPVYVSKDLKTGAHPRETIRSTLPSTSGTATATNGSGPRRYTSSTGPTTCTILRRNISVLPHPNLRSGRSDKRKNGR